MSCPANRRRPWRLPGKQSWCSAVGLCSNPGVVPADYSRGRRPIALGSRPASSQPPITANERHLRELMERMGRSSAGAAMIYLHSSDKRQRKIADALGELAQEELRRPARSGKSRKASGTHVARRAGRAAR